MPRKLLRHYLPETTGISGRYQLRWLGRLLDDPFLLHLNRRSVAGGVAIGLFTAFVPLPGQMLLAATAAILFRVNLVLSVALVWISNPVTIPPMFYFTYQVGTWLSGSPVFLSGIDPPLAWFWHRLSQIWKPLLLGSLVVGGLVSLAGYGAVHLVWRLHVLHHLRLRRARRRPRLR